MRQVLIALYLFGLSVSTATTIPTQVAESLEWITRSSDLIILGRPLKVSPDVIHMGNAKFDEDVTMDVERVLLGTYTAKELTFRWNTDRVQSMKHEVDLTKEPNVTYDRPQLFFFRRRLTEAMGSGEQSWQLRNHILIKQSSQGLPTANGGLARTASEILGAVENEAMLMATSMTASADSSEDKFSRTAAKAQSTGLITPRGSVLFQVAPREYIIVPAYPRLQQYALDLCESRDVNERERGAYMLRSYPNHRSVQMLSSLLKDSGVYLWNISSDTECSVYMVRIAAYDTLRDLGIVAPKPLLEECHSR